MAREGDARAFAARGGNGFPRDVRCAVCGIAVFAMSARQTRCDRCRIFARISVRGPGECWPWSGSTFKGGYGSTRFEGSQVPASRAVWQIENGARLLPQFVVRHTCDNPPCCNPAHLVAGTEAQNAADSFQRGRARRRQGEDVHSARLSWEQVENIRRRHARGASVCSLAREFGMSETPVRRLVKRASWRQPRGLAAVAAKEAGR